MYVWHHGNMATPTRPAVNNAQSPATDPNKPADGTHTVTVHIKLSGSNSAIDADFATLAGTSFTAASAILTWERG